MNADISGRGLGHSFGDLNVLSGIELTVDSGQVLAVVGPSGCGKSTLLELISGLSQPDEGQIEVGGKAGPVDRLGHCAYMPQSDCLLPWYSAIDNAGLALRNLGRSKAEARHAAAMLFERFGLQGFETCLPSELSGGMRQRVAFLRTLLSGKDVLLLDEPLAALDAITRAELQEWLAPVMREEEKTAVLVTHDVEEALYMGDRVAVMSRRPGRVIEIVDSPNEAGQSRSEIVTSPGFTSLRQQIMSLLVETTTAGPAMPDGRPS